MSTKKEFSFFIRCRFLCVYVRREDKVFTVQKYGINRKKIYKKRRKNMSLKDDDDDFDDSMMENCRILP